MSELVSRSDLTLVLAIRRHGSLAAAAESLAVVPSVVTRRLSALEAKLGTRLFQRTTRRLSPTADGEALCARAAALVAGFDEIEREWRERRGDVAGRVRIAATLGFGRRWLAPALAAFQARHPPVAIELHLTDTLPDLAAEGFDGAVWLWSVGGERAAAWVTRRLARNRRVLVAAPDYVAARGAPDTPESLADHDCLVVRESDGRYDRWTLDRESPRARSAPRTIRVAGPLVTNSGELARDWALAGRGIALRSWWDVAPLIADGRLTRVLPGWAMLDADVHWLAPKQPQTPRRVRLLIDHLASALGHEPWSIARGKNAS